MTKNDVMCIDAATTNDKVMKDDKEPSQSDEGTMKRCLSNEGDVTE